MNIRDLEYLVAVAELAHFGRAAEACHVSQPALSGQIRKLEAELGLALFERNNRQVRVTPAGQRIADLARGLLDQVRQIEETARTLADPLAGDLRLGMIHTIGPYLTPRLLPALAHHLPRLNLALHEDMTEQLEAALQAGSLDAAITATQPPQGHLDSILLYDEPFWLALPHGHALADEEHLSLQAVEGRDLLLLADGHCLRDQVLSFCATAPGGIDAANTQNTSLNTLLALVAAGRGITLVPAMSLDSGWMTDTGVLIRRDAGQGARRMVRLVFRKTDPRRHLLERIADVICANLPDTVLPERR